MATGKEIVALALKHKGEEYILGADAPFEDPDYKGPWDCAEFCSWIVYQVSGQVIGCLDNTKPIKKLDPYSGSWYRDGKKAIRKTSYQIAKNTPGAVFIRKPHKKRNGHVAFSQGNGKTIEAMNSNRGVTEAFPDNRVWDICFLIDGIDYD